jgi:S-ribosylhomocysteine lyase LuxS involved in autoinducer biosynthesis
VGKHNLNTINIITDVENNECGQVGKHNLNTINFITDVENNECG